MTPETAEALELSIAHWEENLVAEVWKDASIALYACALCNMFFTQACDGCPVSDTSNFPTCLNTPYGEAAKRHRKWANDPTSANRDKFREAAKLELDFLKSLRVPK